MGTLRIAVIIAAAQSLAPGLVTPTRDAVAEAHSRIAAANQTEVARASARESKTQPGSLSVGGENRGAPPKPGDPAFDRYMHEHAVELEVRSTDGRVIRSGAGVISSDSGYVMTALELVVGGAGFVVSGRMVGSPRPATALAITGSGAVAILQLTGEPPRVQTPLRSLSPPQPGDMVYAFVATPPSTQPARREGRIAQVTTDSDGSVLLQVSFAMRVGTPLYNSQGSFIGIVRGASRSGGQSNRAVFVPDGMPGDWVLYFPARVGDPIAKKPVGSSAR
jgi:hypothetical protein